MWRSLSQQANGKYIDTKDKSLGMFKHEANIIPIPTPLAIRRVKHGADSIGNDSRHVVGVTNGDGSASHAQLAR